MFETELFRSLIGNEKIKKTIAEDILRKKPLHAYIIEGPEGSGKHTAAKLASSALFCKSDQHSDCFPCEKCTECRKVAEGISADTIYINRGTKATLSVEKIRQIKDTLYLAPTEMQYKVYIIEEADKMTVQAQNALLLSLEEPPEFVVFFLLCTDSSLLLETVRSRAPIIKTELFSAETISEYILGKSKNVKYADDEKRIKEVCAAARGSVGKALSLLSLKNSEEIRISSLAKQIVPILCSKNQTERLSLLKKFPVERNELIMCLSDIIMALRDIMLVKKGKFSDLLFYTNREEIESVSSTTSVKRLSMLRDCAADAISDISSNLNAQTVLTLLITKNQ